jgi:flagellar biosynthesis/type III secretory pathway protein FliH
MGTMKVTKEMAKKVVLIFLDQLEQLIILNLTEALKKLRSLKEQ